MPEIICCGCGKFPIKNAVNIDVEQPEWVGKPEYKGCVFLKHNLLSGLPYEDNSVGYIVAHHFLEHLPYDKGAEFLAECYRALRPGGVMTVVVPDFNYVVQAALTGPDHLQCWARLLLYPDEHGEWGHKAAYNPALLREVCTNAGFEVEHVRQDQIPYMVDYVEWQICVKCTKPETTVA